MKRILPFIILLAVVIGAVFYLRSQEPQKVASLTVKAPETLESIPPKMEEEPVSASAEPESPAPEASNVAPQISDPAPGVNAAPSASGEAFNQTQLETLAEITELAAALAATHAGEEYEAPEIPPDLKQKLATFSPALLALVEVARRIPPRKADIN